MDAATLLAQTPPPLTAGAGALGLFILLSMGLATAVLIANMNRRLKRLPRSYDDVPGTGASAPAEAAGTEPGRGADPGHAP